MWKGREPAVVYTPKVLYEWVQDNCTLADTVSFGLDIWMKSRAVKVILHEKYDSMDYLGELLLRGLVFTKFHGEL